MLFAATMMMTTPALAEDADRDSIMGLDEEGFEPQPVVGGKQVKGDRWNATVGIVAGGAYVSCTGTLVHPKVVITASHCVGNITHVLTGADDWSDDDKGTELIEVTSQTRHPDYVEAGNGPDIAVLKLAKKSTQVPAWIGLECILDAHLKNNADVEVVGYGSTNEAGTASNTLLNHGTTVVQSKACNDDEINGIRTGCDYSQRPGGEIGAGGNGVDACFGDSGGPLFLLTPEGDFLVGVTSRAYRGVTDGYPCRDGGIYTRPDPHVKWIEKTANVELDIYPCNEGPSIIASTISTTPGDSGEAKVEVDDPDGDPAEATFEITVPPEHGSVTVNGSGVMTYVANDDYLGSDPFTVRAWDAGNPDYKFSGQPLFADLEIPVTVTESTGACACTTGGAPAIGWLGLIGLVGLIRRRNA